MPKKYSAYWFWFLESFIALGLAIGRPFGPSEVLLHQFVKGY